MGNELFEKAPVHKAYFKMALPVVFSMIITLVYNMVDTYFIAQTNNTNLIAGVSLGAPIFTMMIALGDIFGIGGSSLISRLFGEKRDDEGKRVSAFCFYAAIITGILVTIVMMILRQPILNLLGAKADTITYASDYYTYIALGAPFIILSLTPSNILRTEGFATASMIGSILGSLVNIILDPIFISTLGMGAKGAAIATVLGNIFADVFFIIFILKKSKKLSVSFAWCKVTLDEFKQIFAIGIPASITNIMQSIGIALTNVFLLAYGTEKVAAMGIVMKINMIAVLVLVGFAFGVQPLIGYNFGAKNYKRLKEILKFSFIFQCSLALVLTVVLSVAAPGFIRFFIDKPSIVADGTSMLRMQLISMFFVSIILISTCTFQATGKAVNALILSISRQGIIFIAAIFILSKTMGYNGVIISQPVADILTGVLAIFLYYKSIHKIIK